MVSAAFTLGLAGLAAASPLAMRDVVPNYPPKEISKGFNLVVNATDPSAELSPLIQNTFIASIHTGAGQALVGIIADITRSRIFYVNGTAEEIRYGQSNVISDGGTPPTPQGLQLAPVEGSSTLSTATMNFGPGSPGVGLSRFPEPYVFLTPETFVACNTSLPYYQGQYFITIQQAKTTVGSDGQINKNIPKGCAPIRLIPQCAQLADLPPDAYSSHEFAADSSCYPNVAGLNWKEYGP
jgi:hypothetical protein